MGIGPILTGRFTKKRVDYLKKRAADKDDPRFVFYQSMLDHDTYEGYLKAVGEKKVYPRTFGGGKVAITGQGEIRWTRRMGRIEDAAE